MGTAMADGKDYISCPDELGCIHISEDVLAVTAAAAALEVEGVGSLAANLGSDIAELFSGKKNLGKGVKVSVTDGVVGVELYIMAKYGYSIQDVAKTVQSSVSAAIENASGFTVSAVNVHVSGVTFEHQKKSK